MHTQTWQATKHGWGDTAVDGLMAGIAGGLLMVVLLLALGALGGRGWDETLRQFDPATTPAPLMGAITHLAISGVYGILFASLWRPLARAWRGGPAWLAGLVYGLLLWLLAATVVAARANPGSGWLQGIPPVQLAAAHVLYGLVLGLLAGRRQPR